MDRKPKAFAKAFGVIAGLLIVEVIAVAIFFRMLS